MKFAFGFFSGSVVTIAGLVYVTTRPGAVRAALKETAHDVIALSVDKLLYGDAMPRRSQRVSYPPRHHGTEGTGS